jgi:hypothetical protein
VKAVILIFCAGKLQVVLAKMTPGVNLNFNANSTFRTPLSFYRYQPVYLSIRHRIPAFEITKSVILSLFHVYVFNIPEGPDTTSRSSHS